MNTAKVIKIGGSILSPSEENIFDIEYFYKIKELLDSFDSQFILIAGGGALARKYQNMVKTYVDVDRMIDWIGTSSNNHNAVMMRSLLNEDAEDKVIAFEKLEETSNIEFDKKYLCVGADQPGHSGDTDSVLIARRAKADTVIILKDIDAIYSSDPDTNPNAVKYKNLTWKEYLDVLGTIEFTPKMAVPIDPIASQLARDNGLKVIVASGKNLENLRKLLSGEDFEGTVVSD